MNRQNIIVVEQSSPNKEMQCWGNFKKACEANKIPYHSLKMLKFPINYREFTIRKIRFNET